MLNLKRTAGLVIGLSFTMLMSLNAHAATYTVTAGDSLFKIGELFNTSSKVIMADNHLSSTVIYPGQTLNVSAQVHTVKSGETLYLIAKKYGVALPVLSKANNEWDDYLYVGQKLNVPSAASGTVSTQSSTAAGSYSASDMDLLVRLITAEADNQPYEAKVGVGAVVLNRIKDSRFPSTVSAVIYQKSDGFYQFTPVENGWINKAASADAKKAALDAVKGWDPSNGAVYYFDDSATNKWLWSKPIKARIGKMVFVY